MGFVSTIIVVDDVLKSRTLYEGLLDMRVIEDHGEYNLGLEGGLSLYKKSLFEELTEGLRVTKRSNCFVIYYESKDIKALEKIVLAKGFEFIHTLREQPWGQLTFRFYDYDGHIIEAAEDMDLAILRLVQEGKTLEEVAALVGYPIAKVAEMLQKAKDK